MIEIKSLASSSSGNAYLITDGRFPLLVEMGIPWKVIREKLHFQTSNIVGALLTHEHGDHSRAWQDVAKSGIEIYTGQGTIEALGMSGHRIKPIKARQQFKIETWTVLPLEAHHDAKEPLLFLLVNMTGERVLFATDTFYIKEKIPGMTHILIECNHSLKLLRDNVQAGNVPREMKNRLLQSHFSLENVKEFLKANDLSKVKEIWLLHLSENNSNAELFQREIAALTGKMVIVADK